MTKTIGVELACEGLKKAVSTWEQVSGVFLYANRRTAKELNALGLKEGRESADSYIDMVCRS